jgi:hypothetical protein
MIPRQDFEIWKEGVGHTAAIVALCLVWMAILAALASLAGGCDRQTEVKDVVAFEGGEVEVTNAPSGMEIGVDLDLQLVRALRAALEVDLLVVSMDVVCVEVRVGPLLFRPDIAANEMVVCQEWFQDPTDDPDIGREGWSGDRLGRRAAAGLGDRGTAGQRAVR